jgi:hypothetical protein
MKIFILDDCPFRHHKFTEGLVGATLHRAFTADEAYPILRHSGFDVLFLDHDLEMSGDRCGNGMEVVDAIGFLLSTGTYPSAKAIHCVHSLNPGAAKTMYDTLKALGLETKRCTSAWTEGDALAELVAGNWTFPERWTDPLEWDTPV